MEYKVQLVCTNDGLIFVFSPFFLGDVGVEVIMPSLSALLSNTAGQVLSYETPILSPVL